MLHLVGSSTHCNMTRSTYNVKLQKTHLATLQLSQKRSGQGDKRNYVSCPWIVTQMIEGLKRCSRKAGNKFKLTHLQVNETSNNSLNTCGRTKIFCDYVRLFSVMVWTGLWNYGLADWLLCVCRCMQLGGHSEGSERIHMQICVQ